MKKYFKKFLTIVICGIMGTSMLVTSASAADKEPVIQTLDTYTSQGETTHSYNITETNDWLVKNNSTEYVLVIPEKAKLYEVNGSKDFSILFNEATRANLRIVTDTEFGEWNSNAKVISYGHTSLLEDAGVTYPQGILGTSGFIIKTIGKSIFITGGDEDLGFGYGAAFGGYALLRHLVDFEQYGYDCTYYKSVDELKLYNYDVVDIPDFNYRKDPNDACPTETMRMGFQGWEFAIGVPGYGTGHNSFGYVEPNIWAETHPEWFTAGMQQLCLTAQGDEESRQQMVKVATDKLIEFVMANPEREYISFSMQDVQTRDPYDQAYADEHYGGNLSGLWVRMCNEMDEGLRAYFEENNIDRTVKIFFYAYFNVENAPVAYDENGELYATIRCNENVIPLYAPIFQHQGDSVVSQLNSDVKGIIDNWGLCCDKYWVWFYNATYYDYMFPRFGTAGIQENARYMTNLPYETDFYFVQGQTYNSKLWSWGDLNHYLTSKLSWNVDLDQEELTQDFFDHYYQDASDEMMKLYRLVEANYHYHTQNDSLHLGTDGFEYKTTKMWPLSFLKQLLGVVEEAEKAIEKYKETNYELYETLHKRIVWEKIPFNYAIVYLYNNAYSADDILALKKQIKQDCIYVGALHCRENTPITNLWEEWGI